MAATSAGPTRGSPLRPRDAAAALTTSASASPSSRIERIDDVGAADLTELYGRELPDGLVGVTDEREEPRLARDARDDLRVVVRHPLQATRPELLQDGVEAARIAEHGQRPGDPGSVNLVGVWQRLRQGLLGGVGAGGPIAARACAAPRRTTPPSASASMRTGTDAASFWSRSSRSPAGVRQVHRRS